MKVGHVINDGFWLKNSKKGEFGTDGPYKSATSINVQIKTVDFKWLIYFLR